MQPNYREEAIPFVTYDPDSEEFVINDDAFEFLKSVPAPIGIVAVAGMYRTGKSYLLNRMILNRKSGFGVGPTINPCTKGLWIWGKPVAGYTPEGKPINVLVVDSEGLGALDEDTNHDTRIFSLAILLSSYFLYNSVGSIDESALQNLSLVINLTKHIHLKSQGSHEDIDPSEYSTYFPSFMWVVRDFTLALEDEDGEIITAKEYLEKALLPQKGFSDSVEQKNRIRRLLKTFFKERDCCTVVRPLLDEDDLQTLEEKELEKLRPEFVEEVLNLRKKVISRIKSKTLNGKELNGEMLCNLAQNYLNGINKGIVPNIENAWTYICKNECVKALHESLEMYDLSLKDLVYNQLPMEEMDLIHFHKEAKQTSISEFTKKAVGNIAPDYLRDLKLKIKQKFNTIKTENEKEARKCAQMFLSESYIGTEKKLKNKEFGSLKEFVEELKAFEQYFMENGPLGPNRRLILMEFLKKSLDEGAWMFYRDITNELELEKTLKDNMKTQLEVEMSTMKEDYTREKDLMENKIRNLENLERELAIKETSLKENLNSVIKEKECLERESREKIEEEKRNCLRQVNDIKAQLNQKNESVKEIERNLITTESDFQKQKALLEQKISFLDKTIADLKKKERDYASELKNQRKEHSSGLKDLSSKYDDQLHQIQSKLAEAEEKLLNLENVQYEKDQKHEMDKTEWEKNEYILNNKLTQFKTLNQELKTELEALRTKVKTENDSFKKEYETEMDRSKKSLKEMEKSFKTLEDKYKSEKKKMEKENAILKQKIEFFELQVKETKKQIEENRKAHEQMIRTIESRTLGNGCGSEEENKRLIDLKELHLKEIKELESEYESRNSRLLIELEELREKNNQLELNLTLDKTDSSKEIERLNEELQTLHSTKEKASQKMKALEKEKNKSIEAVESSYKNQLKELERQLEERNEKENAERIEMQRLAEERLVELKNFYEMEKERLEHRIIEEKEKAERKYSHQLEEYEDKLKEEQANHAEELDLLNDELRQSAMQHQSIIGELEHENNLNVQKIDSLENYLKQTKESLNKIQSMNSNALQTQINSFNQERSTLMQKIEKLTMELTGKERIITTLENKNDNLKTELEKKDQSIETFKKDLLSEKGSLIQRLENSKTKFQQLGDEYMEKKLDFNREIALSKQHLEFQNKKISELETLQEEQMKRYEEKLRLQKEEYVEQINNTIEKMSTEKEIAEKKYDEKRKALKELESSISQRIAKIEKEKAVLVEKLEHSEFKKNELEKRMQDEVENLNKELAYLKENGMKDKSSIMTQNEEMRKKIKDTERELVELQANYDRDKALWEGKFEFLEQQKEQARLDLTDSQRKFEETLQQLHKRGLMDKDKLETNQQALINSVEIRYKAQIKELNETHQMINSELLKKNKELEKEVKTLGDKLQMEQRGKLTEQGSLEKKVSILEQSEMNLQKELEELKNEKDKKVNDLQKEFSRERDTLKLKIHDLELKYKDAEGKRSTLVFQNEKEKAKWGMEKDTLISKRQELQEIIEKLEKKQESLLRENEKYKNERGTRRPFYSGIANSGIYASNRFTSVSTTNARSTHFKENFPQHKFIGSGEEKQDKTASSSQVDPSETSSNHSCHSVSTKKSSKVTNSISSFKSHKSRELDGETDLPVKQS